jgi:hypothetical protein
MCLVNQINVMSAHIFKLFHKLNKPVNVNLFTERVSAYLLILTKDAAKRAARKENRARALITAYARLLPPVQRGAGDKRAV